MPVTPAISEVIWPIPPVTGLINQYCSAIDGEGRLHLVYYGNGTEDSTNYYHLWHDLSERWHNDALSSPSRSLTVSPGDEISIFLLPSDESQFADCVCGIQGKARLAAMLSTKQF